MKRIVLLIVIGVVHLLLSIHSYAQGGLWAHMHGSVGGTGAMGNYGTKGVPNATNTPSGRYQGAYWTDKQGNFWMFGGYGPWGYYNDLWKFDPLTVQWTWINGPQTITDQNGEFGPLGVPGPNYYPPARTFGPNCWTDNNGDLWLYGGYGFDINGAQGGLSDLWKYNIASNEWAWMGGSNTVNISPIFGTMGVPAPTNTPGARAECKSGWVDANNNLWMFGGQDGATAQSGVNVRNDMWRYDISTNMWTWMKGAQTLNAGGVWGTKGVEAATNVPPSRLAFTKWKGKDNNFYVFAGGNSSSSRNDLWRYNPATNNWTWLSGSQQQNNQGTYNGKCIPDEITYPKSRIENQTVATSTCTEIFWSFGGFVTITNTQSFNDLWLYNLTTNKWTWVSGVPNTNIQSNPGPLGVAQPGRYIGSRGGVFIWGDSQNNLWIFGGLTYDSMTNNLGLLNDMWRFEPDSTCFDASFTSVLNLNYPTDTNMCVGDSVILALPGGIDLLLEPSNAYSYNNDSTLLTVFPPATTTYTLYGSERGLCSGKDTIVFTIFVDTIPVAAFDISPLVSQATEPDITMTNKSQYAVAYEWYYNNNIIATTKDATYSTSDTGIHCFTLIAYNTLGCSDTVTHCVEKLGNDEIFIPSAFSPNGDDKNNILRILGRNIDLIKFEIYNRWGERVFVTKDITKGWNGKRDGEDAEIGTYFYYVEYNTFKGKKSKKGDITLVR